MTSQRHRPGWDPLGAPSSPAEGRSPKIPKPHPGPGTNRSFLVWRRLGGGWGLGGWKRFPAGRGVGGGAGPSEGRGDPPSTLPPPSSPASRGRKAPPFGRGREGGVCRPLSSHLAAEIRREKPRGPRVRGGGTGQPRAPAWHARGCEFEPHPRAAHSSQAKSQCLCGQGTGCAVAPAGKPWVKMETKGASTATRCVTAPPAAQTSLCGSWSGQNK